ncbi:MAG: helix-turn-helix transcriptional regulator [Pirellulaceae bacterium]
MSVAKELDIGRLVRTLRERLNLTQERFAGKLGVTFATVNRWENGRAKPSPLAMKQLEELVGSLGAKGKDLRREFFAD